MSLKNENSKIDRQRKQIYICVDFHERLKTGRMYMYNLISKQKKTKNNSKVLEDVYDKLYFLRWFDSPIYYFIAKEKAFITTAAIAI